MRAAYDLAVLGAGPAGLGAALWAARQGLRVVVLEQAPFVGGAAASHTVGGLRVDTGSHRLHPSTSPEILAELQSLLGADLQKRPRHGRIRLADRWLAFPLRPADLVSRLPLPFASAAAWDAATGWARKARHDTFAEAVRAGLGPTMLRHFYGPYARKIWGLDPEELAGEQARRRIAANSAGGVLKRVLRSSRGERPFFYYPARGFGQIAEALAAAAVAAGADVRVGLAATGISVDSDTVTVSTESGLFTAERVWSTVPLPALARLANAPRDVRDAAARLQSRAMVLIYLVLDTAQYTEFDAHYLPGPQTPITRVSEPKNYRASADDPPGRTVLCAELPCAVGDEYWNASEHELGALTVEGLVSLGLPRPQPVEVVVHRLAHAYPIYTPASVAAFSVLDEWASGLQPQVLTFGRQGLFAHDNTHHALAMAWAAVQTLLAPSDSAGDHTRNGVPDSAAARWAASREAFTHHIVED